MTNKEVMEKLELYFTEQDPKLVAKVCASLCVDLNRFFCFDGLSTDEKDHLRMRTQLFLKSVKDCVTDKVKKEGIKIINANLDSFEES